MAATAEAPPKEPKDSSKKKEPRALSQFAAFARIKGEAEWTPLPTTYDGVTQDQAKKAAAHALEGLADDHPFAAFRDAIKEGGAGLELAAVSARVWQPITVSVQPQPSKLVIGS